MERRQRLKLLVVVVVLAVGAIQFMRYRQQPRWNRAGETGSIEKALQRPPGIERQEGIAAAILLDTSGSMNDPVGAAGGGQKPKIEIAREAVQHLVRQFQEFALKHPDHRLRVGVYEFSTRRGQPPCRRVVELGAPDPVAAQQKIESMVAAGSTPVGDAMILAKQDLDRSGLSRQHILVVSDGESNMGFTPDDVTRVMAALPETDRASLYFIAFDVDAEIFNPVKEAGALVLAAGSELDLRQALDYILGGKILVEQPAPVK
jgi:Mg-chelatase subunit ChlD